MCVCYYNLYILHGQLKNMKVSTLSALNQLYFCREGKHFAMWGPVGYRHHAGEVIFCLVPRGHHCEGKPPRPPRRYEPLPPGRA